MLDRTIAYGLEFVVPARDLTIGPALVKHGEFSRVVVDFLLHHAPASEPGYLIDVGANIGAITVPFAATRRSWRVLAMEPSRTISALLGANVLLNRLTNVEIAQAAAGDREAVVEFPAASLADRGNYGTLSLLRPTQNTDKTLMLRLDDMAPDSTRLVKIDAEGADALVLQGAQRLLREGRIIWVVEAEPPAPIIEAFLAAGHAVHWLYAPWVSRKPLKGADHEGDVRGDTNIVAFPPGQALNWDLPAICSADEARPGDVSAYPYLSRYGF